MDFKEEFFKIKEGKTSDSNLFKLKQDFDFSGKTVHLFVEDEDDFTFYDHWVKAIFKDYAVYSYPQKGKQNVINAYNELDWQKYTKCRILFFVDKDYDDILQKELTPKEYNFFTTKYYSIENYLVNDEVYNIVLDKLFKCDNIELNRKIFEDLKFHYQLFVETLSIISAWILVYRRKEENAELDNLSFDHFFIGNSFELVRKKYMTQDKGIMYKKRQDVTNSQKAQVCVIKLKTLLEKKANASPNHYSHSEGLAWVRKLQNIENPKFFIRGKYELWFLTEFFFQRAKILFKAFNEKAANHNREEGNKDKIKTYSSNLELNAGNVFLILPPRMSIPNDISSFIIYNYNLNGNN